MMLKNKDKFNH